MESVDHASLHEHALKALAAADMMLAHAPQLKLDEVHTIDMVDLEWLNKVLGVPGATLKEVAVVGGHEGMTSRHKWRLTWDNPGEAELPTALFIKSTPENLHLRETLSMLHMSELEARLYTDLHRELHDIIPKAYYARSYPGGRFMIILEDLEARGIKPYWIKDICTLSHARAVAVAQAKIHSRFWNSPRFEKDMVWVRPRARRFGEQWLRTYFAANRTSFFASDLAKMKLPEYARDLLNSWQKDCDVVYKYWETKPQTLLHGDSHLGNTLEFADGSAGYYDWQCLFRGYGFRDLAYFVLTALRNAECEAHEREIFDLYTDTLEQNGVQVNREEAWRDYCLFIMEPFDALLATITNGGYGHAPDAVERQIETLFAAVQRHDVASLLAQVVKTGSV